MLFIEIKRIDEMIDIKKWVVSSSKSTVHPP